MKLFGGDLTFKCYKHWENYCLKIVHSRAQVVGTLVDVIPAIQCAWNEKRTYEFRQDLLNLTWVTHKDFNKQLRNLNKKY